MVYLFIRSRLSDDRALSASVTENQRERLAPQRGEKLKTLA